jgi:hypothetical protein
VPDVTTATVPIHWYRPPRALQTSAGLHRFYWDLRYQPAEAAGGGGRGGGPSIQAIPYNSAPAPTTPMVAPGRYTVRLTVDGQVYSQPITVKQDPRVKTPALAMQEAYGLTSAVYFGAQEARAGVERARGLRAQIAERLPSTTGAARSALEAYDKRLETTAGELAKAAAALGAVVNTLGAADVEATAVQKAAMSSARTSTAPMLTRWRALVGVELTALNATLRAAGVAPLN